MYSVSMIQDVLLPLGGLDHSDDVWNAIDGDEEM